MGSICVSASYLYLRQACFRAPIIQMKRSSIERDAMAQMMAHATAAFYNNANIFGMAR